ncbi:alpha-ketoglutarate-dependent dioxygenase AlkB [Uruburuella testudinis]|uniref:Alpha-ketoglutarate-dependent dioxygenase AlkB n=2 Tax=Uruburuella testudinis TaxID=1282863 RepID=A0ABY4E2M4_9NEIS|nr:alpha-ketoglutarate-dependent dioxygenase AlkB [Uruburuella testudinis]UOO83166.1 alpha-ketoglutarate-dependent dioxygenase AlkB [Uruburuella testudinis]
MMNGFDLFRQPDENLLPFDGTVNDYGLLMPSAEADACLHSLLHDIAWQHDEVVVAGRRITTARQVAWYGQAGFRYAYSGVVHEALPWQQQPLLLRLKALVEAQIGDTAFNSCLLNLYRNGREGMAWHSDNEAALGRQTVIASLSFGAARKFAFKHKTRGDKREIMLQHGQLLVMRGDTQQYWLHALMKSSRISEPRINLTFRTFIAPG